MNQTAEDTVDSDSAPSVSGRRAAAMHARRAEEPNMRNGSILVPASVPVRHVEDHLLTRSVM